MRVAPPSEALKLNRVVRYDDTIRAGHRRPGTEVAVNYERIPATRGRRVQSWSIMTRRSRRLSSEPGLGRYVFP